METGKDNWYQINNIDQLDSPALVVYTKRVQQNIATAINMIGDVQRLRPHVKTHKMPAVIHLMKAASIKKFKCATIAEGEMLGMEGVTDVLLAYQPVGPKLQRFISLVKKYPVTKFSCLTDNIEAAKQMSDAFEGAGLEIHVYIDLNVGMNRTGILPGAEAIQLYTDCSHFKGIKPVGLHMYDGHIRDAGFEEKKKKCDAAFDTVSKLQQELIGKGFDEPVIIAGGSPTFSIHSKRENIECSPGTFVFWDKGYTDLCPEQNFVAAALVISRVISLPAPNRVCLDLGHKSVSAENELGRRVFFLNAPELKAVGQSEEHLVTETGEGHPYKTGDVLYGLPIHICPTVALYERAYTIEDQLVTGEWKVIARDRKINV